METEIVRQILAWIREHGGDGYKVWGNGVQRSGEPDIDAALPNPKGGYYHMKLEVKTKHGKPTPLQLYRIAQYKKFGYVSGVVTSIDDVLELLKDYD